MVRALVTGGAGFIGSHVVRCLRERGHEVTIFDNLSHARCQWRETLPLGTRCHFVQGDLMDFAAVLDVMQGMQLVVHLAANSDIAQGSNQTDLDLRQGTLTTYHVLEAMRQQGVSELIFASTSAVYGEATPKPTCERDGPLFPISLYGASKLAGEGLISAFAHNYALRAWIYRFGNVVGLGATHGVIVDFIRKLRHNPRQLTILGDGKQSKPYIHVLDCVDGMLWGYHQADEPLNCFNLSSAGTTSVDRIADIVVAAMGLNGVTYTYTGGARGWPGDVFDVRLDPGKFAALGWEARFTSDEAVRKATQAIVVQQP